MKKTENLVQLSPTPIRFGVRSVKIELVNNRKKTEYHDYAEIVIINTKNGRELPHPLTSFIYALWRHREFNTQLARAKHTVAFLNHIVSDYYTTFKLDSLADLTIEHACHFLHHKVKEGCSRSTIHSYDSTLMYFYHYLCRKGVLKNLTIDMFRYQENKKTKRRNLVSLFIPNIQLPRHSRKEDKAKRLEEHHVIPFIETAVEVAPDIALGIYFSCFGGLRGSEVLSVKRSEIKSVGVNGEHGLIVKLKTDDKYARGSGNRVKSPGTQMIEPVKELLHLLYKEHMDNYPDPIDGSDSLFVNKWGYAMQYQNYRDRFNNVKKEFIKRLQSSPNPDDNLYAITYASLKWSTHIGRGIYSNAIAEQCTNIIELMQRRRDKSALSSIHYLNNTKKQRITIGNSLEEMFEDSESS